MSSDVRIVPEIRTGIADNALAKNGDITDGAAMSQLANLAFSALLRRQQVMYSKHSGIGSVFVSGTTHRTLIQPGIASLIYKQSTPNRLRRYQGRALNEP